MGKQTNKLNHSAAAMGNRLKSLGISILTIVFFIAVVVIYYNWLHDEIHDNIVSQGRVSALESASQVEQYLATSVNAVEVTAFTVDQMIVDKRPNKDILNYIVGQTIAVTNTVFDKTTGLYAFVNGEYLDGLLWEPPADFVATERPWYATAVANHGNITLIDPYVDAYSGAVMMTVCKRLSDRRSVVAMDVSLKRLQEVSEKAAHVNGLTYAAIIDSKNKVVAHSDKNEMTTPRTDYSHPGKTPSMWPGIVKIATKQNQNQFEFKYGGTEYLVYSKKLQNSWTCIAVKESNSAFRPLKWLMAWTMSVLVVMSAVLLYILNQSNDRYLRASKLNRQLSAVANTYCAMFDLDFVEDEFRVITATIPKFSTAFTNGPSRASEALRYALDNFVSDRSRAGMRGLYDLDNLKNRLAEEKTVAQEFMNCDGVWRRARFVVSKYADDGAIERVLWIIEDVDGEKRRRDQLINMSERAIAASEAKSAFLSNMSHEIRTPINAVLGMNEMILRECDDANVLAYSDSIKTAGNTLLGLINDILDFSKIESGKMQIVPVDYDLSSVINDLVSMIHTRVDAKGLTLQLGFDRELPKWLNGDDVRIKQIITNILTNAVKYTDKGSITFSIGFERVESEPDSVIINVAVQDTGIGIKEEDMKKLFAQFERIDEQRTRHIEGTGLGMSITTSLLAMMGSCLKVNSVYGSGSVFYFALKQKVVKWEPLGDYESSYNELVKGRRKRYHERFTAPDAVVLMVDDNPMNLMVFKSLLKQTKVRVDLANDGEEGLRLSHDKKYDMIFLDHMMPGKDGIETLHELRSQPDNPNLHTPAICLTANAISGAREKYIKEGFDDYLTKPIDSGQLEEMLMSYLPPEKVQKPDPAAEAQAATAELSAEEARLVRLAALAESGIDVETGVKNSGSMDAYVPLLRIFYESMDETAAAINGFYEADDLKNYTIKVHALKSSARIIGATQFGEQAQKLEDAGKCGDWGYIRGHQAGFMAAYRQFKDPLARALSASADPAEKPEADATLMAEVFAEIRAGAEDMDGDRLEGVFQEMADYRVPAGDAELWTRLRESAGRYDYEALTRLLDEAGK